MVITGYMIPSADLSVIDKAMQKVKRTIDLNAYHMVRKMLAEEAAFLCDAVSLGQIQQPDNCTLFDWAEDVTRRKTQVAAAVDRDSKFNLGTYVHILTDGTNSYVNVLCKNKLLLASFRSLSDYSLSEEECKDSENVKTKAWNAMHALYEKRTPVAMNLTPDFGEIVNRIKKDGKKLPYPSLMERAEQQARYAVSNHYLNLVSGGQQIQPIDLMPDIDEVLEYLSSEDGKTAVMERKSSLLTILVDLQKDDSCVYGNQQQEADANSQATG